MLGIILGAATILLGIKGFSADGIPLSKERRIRGKAARIIGVACVALGILFVVDGIFAGFSMWELFR